MQGTGLTRIARTHIGRGILHVVNQNSETSVLVLTAVTGTSLSTVWRVLQTETLHPFNFQTIQLLQTGDY